MAHVETHAQTHSVRLDNRGRLQLPSALRRDLKLHPGDELVLTVEDEATIHLASRGALAHSGRGLYRSEGQSLVEELLAERRAEAEQNG